MMLGDRHACGVALGKEERRRGGEEEMREVLGLVEELDVR